MNRLLDEYVDGPAWYINDDMDDWLANMGYETHTERKLKEYSAQTEQQGNTV